MIKAFANKNTAAIFDGLEVKRIARPIQSAARRKLKLLDAVARLEDLRVPPRNRLETLKGDRKGQWSIRVNDQWRICFRWQGGHSYDVELTDYHG